MVDVRGSSLRAHDHHRDADPEAGCGWRDLVRLPDFSSWDRPEVLQAGLVLATVASVETLVNLGATDRLDPLRRHSPPDRELVAQGIGNALCGLLGGVPVTSAVVRSSVSVHAGARTRAATVIHGALIFLSVLVLSPFLNRIPLAAIAAVLAATGLRLCASRIVRRSWDEGPRQFVPFAVTVAAILLTDVLTGIACGLLVSVGFILYANLRRGFRIVEERHVAGTVHRIELEGQASFLMRAKLASTLARFTGGDQVAIDARLCDEVDPDVLALVREYAQDTAPARGVQVSLLGFRDRYALHDRRQYVDWTSKEVQAPVRAWAPAPAPRTW